MKADAIKGIYSEGERDRERERVRNEYFPPGDFTKFRVREGPGASETHTKGVSELELETGFCPAGFEGLGAAVSGGASGLSFACKKTSQQEETS